MTLLNKTEQKGFTLLELMLVVAIIGILSAIAIPSYYSTIEKSRRSDAMDAVLDCAAAQARNFSSESPSSYLDQADALATGGGPRYCGSDGTNLNSKEGFYILTIRNINPNPCTTTAGSIWCFEVEATPAPGSPQANDEDCQLFRVDHRGNRTAEGTGLTDDEAQDICWRS